MQQQQTFSDIEYGNRRKKTKRERFLSTMDLIIPWEEWIRMIRPYYPAGKKGRPPKNLETMLRMYLIQEWYHLSASGTEDAVNDSYSLRSFMHLDFLNEQVPDSTTLLHFRHLIETHKLREKLSDDLKERLSQAGLLMHEGTMVDASVISAPNHRRQKTDESGQTDETA